MSMYFSEHKTDSVTDRRNISRENVTLPFSLSCGTRSARGRVPAYACANFCFTSLILHCCTCSVGYQPLDCIFE